MSFFQRIKSFLCDPGADPVKDWHHETLGDAIWTEDGEAWAGSHNNIQYLLAYEGDCETPPVEVVDYALVILAPDFDLVARFEELKAQSMSGYPERLHPEIARLMIESIHLYRGKNCPEAIACLAGGEDSRSWRFDMLDTKLSNLAFDT
jgi:hypothetical protein